MPRIQSMPSKKPPAPQTAAYPLSWASRTFSGRFVGHSASIAGQGYRSTSSTDVRILERAGHSVPEMVPLG